MTVSAPEESWVLELPPEEEGACRLNGVPVEDGTANDLFLAAVGIRFDRLAPDSHAGAERFVLRYDLRDGTALSVRCAGYDDDYDRMDVSGGGAFLVRNTRTDALLEALRGAGGGTEAGHEDP